MLWSVWQLLARETWPLPPGPTQGSLWSSEEEAIPWRGARWGSQVLHAGHRESVYTWWFLLLFAAYCVRDTKLNKSLAVPGWGAQGALSPAVCSRWIPWFTGLGPFFKKVGDFRPCGIKWNEYYEKKDKSMLVNMKVGNPILDTWRLP